MYVKNLIIFLFFLLFSGVSYGQTISYSYTDPCTGAIKTISVPSNGVTVTYYGQIRTFAPGDFYSGTFESWAQGVFSSFGNNNPCASVVGMPAAVTVAQSSAINFLGIVNSLSSLADMATGTSNMLGGSVGSMQTSTGGNSSSGSKGGNKNKQSNGNNSNNNVSSGSSNGSGTGNNSRSTGSNNGQGNQNGTQGGSSSTGTSSQSSGTTGSSSTGTSSQGSSSTGSGSQGSGTTGSTTNNGSGQNSGNTGSGGNGTGTGNGSGQGNSQETGTTGSESEGKTNLVGSSVNSIGSSSGDGSGSSGGNNKAAGAGAKNGNRPSILASSDFVGFNFKNSDVTYGGKVTGGLTSMRWDGRRSWGINADYTSALRGPNITGFYAFMKPKRIDLISTSVTIGFEAKPTLYGTLALGQMWTLNKPKNMKLVYMLTASSGQVYGEPFIGTAVIAGGMHDWNVNKRIAVKTMLLYVYAPYVSYYNDILLKSPHVVLPIIGTNVGITKRFKININVGGAWAIKDAALNYTVMMGTRMLL